jgi:uncharacterized protein
MRNGVFVDTSAFVALVDRRDRNHQAAKQWLESLGRSRRSLLTSTDVADEVITLVRMKLGHRVAVQAGVAILESRWCKLLEVEADVRARAWNLFVRYEDQTFSFTDCTSFALMHQFDLNEAFTFDRRDFSAAGFAPVPTATL